MSAHNFKDLTGQKFGRLTVIARAENAKQGQARWKCRCDCGNEVVVRGSSLANGKTKSCGCLRGENHGMRGTREYHEWQHMIQRCTNPNRKDYPDYGGRGITVCKEWRDSFVAFYNCVSKLEHYGEPGYSLDRIDVNGDYKPGNVRWATNTEQARNKRSNISVEYNGEKMLLKDAAELSGINYKALLYRYHKGDRGERLFRPVRK